MTHGGDPESTQPSVDTAGGVPLSGESVPLPGRQALLMAALLIGLVLMGLQLWLLTVALDMYLAGEGEDLWLLALVSGLVFAGGLLAWRRSA